MAESRLKRAHGNWVSGDRFWGREAELQLFAEYLEEGAHLLIVAQRRIGKTSFMREAMRRLGERFLCFFVDLRTAQSAADVVVELSLATRPYVPFWERTKAVFGQVLDKLGSKVESLDVNDLRVQLRSGLTLDDWQARGDRLLETLAAADEGVVFLDEVPILVNRILQGDDYQITQERRQQTDAFMSWLRGSCLRHQGKLRFVVTGSIGLELVLRQAGQSSTLDVLVPFELGPWSRGTAVGCIEALAHQSGLEFRPEAVETILDLLGASIPHHVQMIFDNVYHQSRLQGLKTIDRSLVEEVYHRDMLGVRGHAELSHLEERLKVVLGPDRYALALALLTETAVTGELTSSAALTVARECLLVETRPGEGVRAILGILEHDGYLCRDAVGTYVFGSRLLGDWWKARFGFGYVPAAERAISRATRYQSLGSRAVPRSKGE